jgi:hypothetical protein
MFNERQPENAIDGYWFWCVKYVYMRLFLMAEPMHAKTNNPTTTFEAVARFVVVVVGLLVVFFCSFNRTTMHYVISRLEKRIDISFSVRFSIRVLFLHTAKKNY